MPEKSGKIQLENGIVNRHLPDRGRRCWHDSFQGTEKERNNQLSKFVRNAGICALVLGAGAVLPATAAPLAKPAAFATCNVCHKVDKGQPSSMGPNLWGISTRKAGSITGFSYSPAMKKLPYKWDRAKLIAFVTKPQAVVPGTRMAFVGIKDPVKAAQVADYLMALK
jgi:cytochrome c